LVIVPRVPSSVFTEAAGPADWFLIALVRGAGLISTVVPNHSGLDSYGLDVATPYRP